jgi:hypothetical protein
MTVADLIHEAESHGIELWAEGSALRYRGDSKAVQALLPRIRQHKPAILAALAGEAPAAPEIEPANNLNAITDWDRISELTGAGWRAEFGPLGPDGRQPITWRKPGEWEPTEADQDEALPRNDPVRCCDCRHAIRTDHPALIRCGVGRLAPGACIDWWTTDQHECGQFEKEIQR